MYFHDRSYAHVRTRASFSIYAYRWFRLVSSLLTGTILAFKSCMVENGKGPCLSHRRSYAPLLSSPYLGHIRLVPEFNCVRSALIFSNALRCSLPFIHWFSLWSRSLMIFFLSARSSVNLLHWFTMLRNVLTFCIRGT